MTHYYYHQDHLGNICAVWDATHDSIVQQTLYYASGLPVSISTGQDVQPYKYNGKEYVEGIGSLSGDFFQLINRKRFNTCPHTNHLICASQDGQLLYQMDDTEMEQLGAECLCEGYVSTSVETIITPNTNDSKHIQDGQLFILRDSKTYNVMGVEVGK
jgi:hypothetical protein